MDPAIWIKTTESLLETMKECSEEIRLKMLNNIKLGLGNEFYEKIIAKLNENVENENNEKLALPEPIEKSPNQLNIQEPHIILDTSTEDATNESDSWESESSLEFEFTTKKKKKVHVRNIGPVRKALKSLFRSSQIQKEKLKSQHKVELEKKLAGCTIIDTVELLSDNDDDAEILPTTPTKLIDDDGIAIVDEPSLENKVLESDFKDIPLSGFMDVAVTNYFYGRKQEVKILPKNKDIRNFFQKSNKLGQTSSKIQPENISNDFVAARLDLKNLECLSSVSISSPRTEIEKRMSDSPNDQTNCKN